MKTQATGLHPFSRPVALWVGGIAVVVATAVFWWVRQQVPSDEELARRFRVAWGVPGGPAVEPGGQVPAGRPVEVRFQHDFPRAIGLVAVALGPEGALVWLVPAGPAEPPLRLGSGGERARVGGPLGPGRWKLVSLVGVGEGAAAAWLARWQAGQAGEVGRVVEVEVR